MEEPVLPVVLVAMEQGGYHYIYSDRGANNKDSSNRRLHGCNPIALYGLTHFRPVHSHVAVVDWTDGAVLVFRGAINDDSDKSEN